MPSRVTAASSAHPVGLLADRRSSHVSATTNSTAPLAKPIAAIQAPPLE